ncbi:hypothetical protein ACFVYR_11600 [Streptomyces sp. NPDC058284]|uniref:hypothetical protein n=1 Tax=unclassified Streptomyces TaxID=2593676 RepID=UPI0036699DEA
MLTRTKLTTALAASVLTAGIIGGASATAASSEHSATPSVGHASAASCLGGDWSYDGYKYAPQGDGYYVTTNRCDDIQVKPDRDTKMKLCYLKNRNPDNKVCKGWVTAKAAKWTVLGKDFNDGVYFYLDFPNSPYLKTGWVAA